MERNWRDWGSCRNEDPELFFPVGTTGPAVPQIECAKRICQSCSVRSECLEDAMRPGINDSDGIRGGLTAQERSNLKKSRARRRKKEAA